MKPAINPLLHVASPGKRNTQLGADSCNTRCNSGATPARTSPMTGSELRAQLRTQQPRNRSGGACNSDAEKVARSDAGVQPARDTAPCRRWHVYFNDGRPPLEVIFSDDQTLVEVHARYPGAVQPAPEIASRSATPAEADELRALVAAILSDGGEADRAEALAIALADPDAALMLFRTLAADALTSERR